MPDHTITSLKASRSPQLFRKQANGTSSGERHSEWDFTSVYKERQKERKISCVAALVSSLWPQTDSVCESLINPPPCDQWCLSRVLTCLHIFSFIFSHHLAVFKTKTASERWTKKAESFFKTILFNPPIKFGLKVYRSDYLAQFQMLGETKIRACSQSRWSTCAWSKSKSLSVTEAFVSREQERRLGSLGFSPPPFGSQPVRDLFVKTNPTRTLLI